MPNLPVLPDIPDEAKDWGHDAQVDYLYRLAVTYEAGSSRRESLLMQAENIKGQNFPRQAAAGTAIMVDGTAYFQGVGLVAGDIVTKIMVCVTTLGASVTLSKVGLYTTGGSLLASSADQGTAWQSTGIKEISLSSPFTVVTSGAYYLAVISKASVTLPTLLRGNSTGGASAAITGGVQAFGTQLAQTDLPSPATIASTAAIAYWTAWS